ncbi:MAG TPA: tetratricopeptide repeat protein, partial [Balneolaceae bacterium]
NRAVKLATEDSLKKTVPNYLQKSVQRLQNATIIQPDSALSWAVLSQVSAMNQNYEQAAKAQEQYFTLVPDTAITVNDYMRLASYYYQLDKQQEVLEVFQNAAEQYPKNEKVVSNLADAYSRTGNSDKAIETVENLVEQFPENAQYHLVLGSQIYQRALHLSDTLSANTKMIADLQQEGGNADKIAQLKQENQQLEKEITELTNRAEEELKTALEYRPDDAAAYNTLGIIYQNKAKSVFDERNRTVDNQKAAELDARGEELLRTAMKYYEQAAEIDPENQSYWRSLFSIYTALGMDEQAREAMEKAGIE